MQLVEAVKSSRSSSVYHKQSMICGTCDIDINDEYKGLNKINNNIRHFII